MANFYDISLGDAADFDVPVLPFAGTATSDYYVRYFPSAGRFGGSSTVTYIGTELTYETVAFASGGTTQALSGGVVDTILTMASGSVFSPTQELYVTQAAYQGADLKPLIAANDSSALWEFLTAGNDVFVANRGPDVVRAGAGDDQVYVTGTGNKSIYGGSGSNAVYAGAGDDTIIAGSLTTIALDVNDWSTAYGGAGNDAVLAGYGSNGVLYGGDGHDYLIDGTGTDLIYGGAGFDYIAAGTGANYLMFDGTAIVGGEYDTVDYFNASAATYVGFAAAYQPYVSFAQLDGTVQISTPTSDGQSYSIFVLSASVADVQARLFYF